MRQKKLIRWLMTRFISFGGWVPLLAAQPLEVRDHCDLPLATTIRSVKTKDVLTCQIQCQEDLACKLFVFVSGWQRCFLKMGKDKQFSVKFFTGVKLRGKIDRIDEDTDISSGDILRVDDTNLAQCKEKCRTTSACKAFTWIAGYRTCWLKNEATPRKPKIFYCGFSPR